MDKNSYLIDLCERPRTDFGKRPFSDQARPQQVFSTIWELESEVCNGGLLQYFTNCFGEPSVVFAPAALREIGAQQCADIVERAIALLPASVPTDLDARSDSFESKEGLLEQLAKLDEEFYSYPDKLTELLFAFVSAHPSEFGPTPNL